MTSSLKNGHNLNRRQTLAATTKLGVHTFSNKGRTYEFMSGIKRQVLRQSELIWIYSYFKFLSNEKSKGGSSEWE